MPKSGKVNFADANDNQDTQDTQQFENYEKHNKSNQLESLKNKDILNYIKDFEQNCRLEANSGDEDYAGTKRSSDCNIYALPGTQFKSSKKVKSGMKSKRNKNATSWEKKRKQSINYNNEDTYNQCCSTQKSCFCNQFNFTTQENSRKDSNSFKSATNSNYRYPISSNKRDSYKYHESSPRFYGWYSRKDDKIWPAVKMTSLEVIKNRSQNAVPNSRINGSRINRKSSKIRTFKSLRRNYSNIPPNEKINKRDRYYRFYKRKEDMRMEELNEESDISSFVNQQPFNKSYPVQYEVPKLAARSYQTSLRNGGYNGDYTPRYRYPARRFQQSTSWGPSLRSNRLIASTRLPETTSLSQRRTSQWESEVGPPLRASSAIMGASIDRSYRQTREPRYKNNMDQGRRKPDILAERKPSCYRKPSLLRESGKLCKVVPTREDKQWLGCCCENDEQDEEADCSMYCRCPENVSDRTWLHFRPQFESTRRPVGMGKRSNYFERETALCEALCKSAQSRNDDREANDFDLTEENLHDETTVYDKPAFDKSGVSDDDRTKDDYDDNVELEALKPHLSLPDERTYQTRHLNDVARERNKKSSNDLNGSQKKVMEAREASRKRTNKKYPSSKELFFKIKTPKKPVSRDSSRLQYDIAECTCKCREPFHDPPAACLTGSCTCIENNENDKDDSDSSQRRSSVYYCCCSSCSLHDEKDPLKKLESFCEKVKAMNQNVFYKPSRSTHRNSIRTNNAQRYYYSNNDELLDDQSENSTRIANQTSRPIEREWLADTNHLRLGKPKHSRGKTNLENILIYPPRGEKGPPLMLYKKASDINCRVKGDANAGFRYSVTYVQKFVSPTWMPSYPPEVLSRETDEECSCAVDYG